MSKLSGKLVGSGATFLARSVDTFQHEQRDVMKAAHAHKGASFVEISTTASGSCE